MSRQPGIQHQMIHKLFCTCKSSLLFLFVFYFVHKILHNVIFEWLNSPIGRYTHTMDRKQYHNFDLMKTWKNVYHSFFEHSVGMKISCMIYRLDKKTCGTKNTITINEFILKFFIIGTFMSGFTPLVVDLVDQDGKLVLNMLSEADEFWNGSVWEEWKERF